MDISNNMKGDLKNRRLSRSFLAEKYGYDTEDIRASDGY